MKALLDEQLSGIIARELRSRGLDVEAVCERPDLMHRPDAEIMEAAAREGRAVVTNNIKDFRPLAARRLAEGRGHAGLILLPARRSRTRAAAGALATALEEILRESPDGIANSERWVPPIP